MLRHSILTGCFLTLASLHACSDGGEPEPPKASSGLAWEPGTVYRSAAEVRGLLDSRGVIHAHSVYSHDACDGEPRDATGALDQACLADFRRGMCQSAHDYIMLTDHRDSFVPSDYPDVLLYDAAQGDILVERDGRPVANWAACPDGSKVLLLAGTEAATMPVGLEAHVDADPGVRSSLYGDASPSSIEAFKGVGAVALVAHTEGWSVDDLTNLPLDGFEMYNVHANAYLSVAEILQLKQEIIRSPEVLPHPDLIMLPMVKEMDLYLETWGSVLARGAKRVTTMGTDCHRNSFPEILPDGERLDSYRRMMIWFSNHLLVRPGADGTWDDRHLKEALAAGRLYGVFEYLGYPIGFDFHALAGGQALEMGSEVSVAAGAELVVRMPAVQQLSQAATAPEKRLRLLRAREGGWDEVASGASDLHHTPSEPGAYRAEVRMKPRHLVEHLNSYADHAEREVVWIYSNAIYVTP